jgi:hypothetical protein
VRRRALYCLAFVAALPLVGELSLFQRFVPVLFSMAAVGLIGLSGRGDGAMPWDRDFRIHNREKLLGISTPALLYFLAGVTATLATIDIAALNLQVISQHVVPLTLFTITVALLAFWSLRNRYTVSGDSDLLGYDFGAKPVGLDYRLGFRNRPGMDHGFGCAAGNVCNRDAPSASDPCIDGRYNCSLGDIATWYGFYRLSQRNFRC